MDSQITLKGVYWGFVGLAVAGMVVCLFPTSTYADFAGLANPKKVYAVSDSGVKAYHISLDELPRDSKDATDINSGALDNWPKRADRCSSYGAGGADGLKAFPMLPKNDLINAGPPAPSVPQNDDTIYVIPSGQGWAFNRMGAYRGSSGDCKTTGAVWTGDPKYSIYDAADVKALRDAGTSVAPAWTKTADNGWAGVAGYSISPTHYGGWATTMDGYDVSDAAGWHDAVQIKNDIVPIAACNKSAGHPNYDGVPYGTYWVSLSGLGNRYTGVPGGGFVQPIWSSKCQDATDYAPSLLDQNGYSDPDILSMSAASKTPAYPDNRTGIYSFGMTLFRKEFDLTQDDIDRIVEAEGQTGGGLYIDMVADDFYDLYINGKYVHSNAINSTNADDVPATTDADAHEQIRFQVQIKAGIPGTPGALKVGKNLIAISVMDDISSTSLYLQQQTGVGLGFAMVLNEPKGYTLNPTTTCDKSQVTPGEVVSCAHAAGKNGVDPDLVNPTKYTVSCTVEELSSGTMLSGAAVNAAMPGCSSGVTAVASMTDLENGVSKSFTVPSSWAGYKICTSITYTPKGKNTDGTTMPGSVTSTPACVLIASRPYVTIVGGNVWSGGSTVSPYTGISDVTAAPSATFGSFGDYGVFSTGKVDYFGSAGQLGKAYATSGMANGGLTFANAPNLGSYSSSHKITDMTSITPASALTVSGSMVIPGTGVYKATSPITITTSTMAPGAHVSIYAPNDTVTIDGNITYGTGGVSSFAQLPSLTIVAKRIQISGAVTEVAGNFYASDSFVTCYQGPEKPADNAAKSSFITSTGTCNKRLDIHGAVTVANQAGNSLVFNRSYGGTKDGEPAEVIQMRPEVFLTAYEESARPANMTVMLVQETELPSRY